MIHDILIYNIIISKWMPPGSEAAPRERDGERCVQAFL